MDIWEVDDKGRIVSHTENKEIDTIYLVNKDDKGNITRRTDDDGNEISISFEYGTIEKTRSITFSPDGKTPHHGHSDRSHKARPVSPRAVSAYDSLPRKTGNPH